ncbi:MAG: hypothetical protein IJ789_00315 [Bacteroidales bacterium]|nr:hypothetical protein [Bacteroidales bacterium]
MNRDNLLEHYRSGQLDADQAEQLAQAAGRDQVLARARQVAHRRQTRLGLGAGLAVTAIVAATLLIHPAAQGPTQLAPSAVGPQTAINLGPSQPTQQSGQGRVEVLSTSGQGRVEVLSTSGQGRVKVLSTSGQGRVKVLSTSTAEAPQAQPSLAPTPGQPQPIPLHNPGVETRVVCNTQCNADSVINEIWNFLDT